MTEAEIQEVERRAEAIANQLTKLERDRLRGIFILVQAFAKLSRKAGVPSSYARTAAALAIEQEFGEGDG